MARSYIVSRICRDIGTISSFWKKYLPVFSAHVKCDAVGMFSRVPYSDSFAEDETRKVDRQM